MFHSTTQLFGVLASPSKEGVDATIQEMKEKVDGYELRLDLLPPIAPPSDCPLILTWKGGSLNPLFSLLHLNPAYVDLPHDAPLSLYETIAKRSPTTRFITSYHNFESTPEDLPALYASIKNPFTHHIKIACQANSILDSLRMLHLVKGTGCIGLTMGPLGAPTRILAPIVGTPLIYAGAPGQITLEELLTTYRFRSLSPSSKIFGLIGNPVDKSPSHRIHNALFNDIGIDAVYVKMPLQPDELTPFFSLIEDLPFYGLSITAPYKESLTPNPINTLTRTPTGWLGTNTDGRGCIDALGPVSGKHIVLLGAGGAAKAIAHEAIKRGARLTICNRTISRGRDLATSVSATFSPTLPSAYDILINTTPALPETLIPGTTIMDLPSAPCPTPLLEWAEREGCTPISGFHMFIYQAIGQFEHWLPEKKEAIRAHLLTHLLEKS